MMFKPVYQFGHREVYKRDSKPIIVLPKNKVRSSLEDIPEFPWALHVETTTHCDNNCIFCTRNEFKRPEIHMPEKLFKKLIDECALKKKIKTMFFFKDGDPVLAPKLPAFIKYAKEKKAAEHLMIATSGNALNAELSKKLILSGLDEISFSIDALTEEKYKQIKQTEFYGKVLKNIFEFVRIREGLNQKKPQINAKILYTDMVSEDIDLFIRMWINVADTVVVDKELNIWDGSNKRVTDLINNMDNYNFSVPEDRFPCNRPWYMACIHVDGKVGVCPEDWNQNMIIGDLNNDTLENIWNGDKLREIKRAHIEGDYKNLDSCRNCEAWVLKNQKNWFKENKEIALRQKSFLQNDSIQK